MSQAKFDYGQQSRKQRALLLRQMMIRWGMTAQIFPPVLFENGYATVYPEYTQSQQPTGTCEVLLGQQGFHGFKLSDFISLADKVHETIEVTTTASLEIETQLLITYPDNLALNLRIIEAVTQHALSRVSNKYRALVM